MVVVVVVAAVGGGGGPFTENERVAASVFTLPTTRNLSLSLTLSSLSSIHFYLPSIWSQVEEERQRHG